MDYSMRIYNAGFKVGLIPDAYVYHKRRTSIPKFFRQIFNWGVARVNLSRRHPHTLKLVHLLPAILIIGLLLLALVTCFTGIAFLPVRILWEIAVCGFLAVCLLAFLQSLGKYRDITVAFLSIITLLIQVFAYGFRASMGRLECPVRQGGEGFSKNYYGNKK